MTVLGVRVEGERLIAALARPERRTGIEAGLAAHLPSERWFPAKGMRLRGVRIRKWAPLDDAGEAAYAIASIQADEEEIPVQLLLGVGDGGVVVEGPAHAAVSGPLARFLEDAPTRVGTGVALAVEAFVQPLCVPLPARAAGAEQSNSSVVYGDRAIAKLYRRAVAGPNPEVELLRYLSAAAPGSVPSVYAAVSAETAEGRIEVLLLQEFLAGADDGWEWMCTRLRGGDPQRRAEAEDGAGAIGSLTARIHAALASAPGEGMAPRPCGPPELRRLGEEVAQEAEATAQMLERSGLDPGPARAASARLGALSLPSDDLGLLTRVHGDFHLGQVLTKEGRFVAIDFEGEPARPLEERRALQHPLTDVAGMLRSFGYASAAAGAPEAEMPLRSRYLEAYLGEAARAPAPFLPRNPEVTRRLLALLELRKALYEVRYELRNRPQWVSIPLAALSRCLEALQ